MVQILLTILMLGLMVFLLTKKINAVMCMLGISMVTLLIYTAVTGQSVLGDASIGNNFLDVFELIYTQAANAFKKNVLIVMCIMGYVAYMDYLKAGNMFAIVCSKPLLKLNKPFIAVIFGALFVAILKIVIPSSVGSMALALGTVYPVMRKCKVSVPACAATMMIGAAFIWGPADANTLMAISAAGIEADLTYQFVTYQIPMFFSFFIPAIIVHFFTTKLFDKKETESGKMVEQEDGEMLSAEELGIPKWFAILPLLPLIFAIVFSKLVLKSVNLSLVAASFLSLFVALILHIIVNKKNVIEEINNTTAFFKGTGDYAGKSGWIIVAGGIYGVAVTAIGGADVLVNLLNAGGGSPIAFFIPIIIVGAIMGALVMQSAPITTFAPIVAAYCETLPNAVTPALLQLMAESSAIAAQFYPASSGILLLTSTTEVPIFQIFKRAAAPIVTGIVTLSIFSLIMYL